MQYLKKLCLLLVASLMLNLCLPEFSCAQEAAASSGIPKHEPQSWSSPEQEIPSVKEEKPSRWTWVLLIALAGGVAAAAGAGGGGGGSSSGAESSTTGSYTGSW
jgi:hypothetical protein